MAATNFSELTSPRNELTSLLKNASPLGVAQCTSKKTRRFSVARPLINGLGLSLLVGLSLYCLLATATSNQETPASSSHQEQRGGRQQSNQKAALEDELNAILQHHAGSLEATGSPNGNKHVADAIISRIMLDNLTGSGASGSEADETASSDSDEPVELVVPVALAESGAAEVAPQAESNTDLWEQQAEQQPAPAQVSAPIDPGKLQKVLGYLRGYDNYLSQYPSLPSGQVSTMKRAAMKLAGAYLGQQPQSRQLASAANGYRNTFDFGLGKRPDMNQASGLLRFGDALPGVAGAMQTVNQFGKRPSAHRYDFGLGKRVVNAYPRYDFGLGKRAPNKLRYDFGLGK